MSSAEFKNYYAILGVEKTADARDIKRNFRQLALKYHPDRNQGNKAAETKFKEISEAYDVLSDQDKRARYDRYGQHWEQGGTAYTTPKSSSPSNTASQADFDSTDFSQYGNFDEFINELLGRFSTPNSTTADTSSQAKTSSSYQAAKQARKATASDNTTISLSYAEAFHGTTKQLNLGLESMEVRIPAGAKPGSRIRLAGKGQSPGYGSPRGDLYLNVALQPHPFFDFEGDNLVCEVPITPDEAVLGTSVSIPTPDGRVRMKIPAGINSGQVLRLRGKGWSSPLGDRTDQLVRIVVETPQKVDSQIRKFYEKIRNLRQDNPRQQLEGINL
ncbi:MAG: DnaJ C-terminal domain-containing protein [Cyanobacteria bacterium P01_C01_bin.72]